MTNPYAYLSAEKFWRSGVADQDTSRTFDNIWTSRFPLEKTTKFLTAGSCFAQHISKWLISNGYQWIDTEPAPAEMSDAERLENNYGVFSFRTGNIYTSSLLRQWLEQALTISPSPIEEVFVEDGRYFDPLRPLISKNGFATKEELLTARTLTVQNIKTGFENADVFIFTLGLTESWKHKVGYTYAMCPGTAKGTFDRETVLFENLDYQTILFDLERCFELIKSVNPEMKFLLTVSPVPLTATASEDHVLPATIYSKSVLRGVAGHLKATREDVDYFPSYELISSFPIRGAYYEENLRSVKPSGVEFVMRHFEQGISTPQAAVSEKTGAQPPVPAAVAKDQNEDDVLCDEVMLENWNPHKSVSQADHYCLIGDSHMGLLSESLTRLGVSNAGGMIMNGAAWTSNLFHLD
ncbi:MAG: GSCFA domain-containing protein, partial [Rhodobacteraceae bacterium]|nr:GSCFA domain-containing protein [Paracoccaceae bacterium]